MSTGLPLPVTHQPPRACWCSLCLESCVLWAPFFFQLVLPAYLTACLGHRSPVLFCRGWRTVLGCCVGGGWISATHRDQSNQELTGTCCQACSGGARGQPSVLQEAGAACGVRNTSPPPFIEHLWTPCRQRTQDEPPSGFCRQNSPIAPVSLMVVRVGDSAQH